MTHHARTTRNVVAAVAVTLVMTVFSMAQYSETPIYTFTGGSDGAIGGRQLVSDSAGNLYGTTISGGNKSTSCAVQTGVPGCGVVFKLTPTGKYTVLHTFTGGEDGAFPYAGVTLDSAGNLYGTTFAGGDKKPKVCHYLNLGGMPAGCGVVFKLTPAAHGPWKETVLYTFTGGKDGAGPFASVIFDSGGNLYGAGGYGGDKPTACEPYGCGVVFKLTPTANGPWTEKVLYRFDGVRTGLLPVGVTFGSGGNLYGITYVGGDKSAGCVAGYVGCGVVFKLKPTAHGLWKETVLHAFTDGKDGGVPQGTPIVDQKDNVYGTTVTGGDYGPGVVYELTPRANGTWEEKVLHTFTGRSDGGNDQNPVVLDSTGNLYGTTDNGGDPSCNGGSGCGVVFKLTPTTKGPWTETVLYPFTQGTDGDFPHSNLLFDSTGDIFGMTTGGGDGSECLTNKWGIYGCGVVFKLTP